MKFDRERFKYFMQRPVPESWNTTLYFFGGVSIGFNIFAIIISILEKDWSNIFVHIIIPFLTFIYLLAYHRKSVNRIITPFILIIIASFVAFAYMFFKDALEQVATVFGITTFIWLLLENIRRD